MGSIGRQIVHRHRIEPTAKFNQDTARLSTIAGGGAHHFAPSIRPAVVANIEVNRPLAEATEQRLRGAAQLNG